MSDQAIDPRARQLAESRYRNGYGATVAEAWDQLDTSLREFLVNEATSWLGAAIAAGIALPTTEDLASADNPTPLRWGLNDVQWGDDGSVIVMLSGPDREAYWLELDPERAAVLREDLAGPAEDPAPAETLIGSITIRSESVQLDNGECLRDLAVGDSVELRADTGHEGLWIAAAFHGDYQEQITLQYAEVVDDCGNDPVIACKFSGTRHAHPVDLNGKVRPPTP